MIGSWYKTREHPSRALFFQVGISFGDIPSDTLFLTKEVCDCRAQTLALESSVRSFSTASGLATRAMNPGVECLM